jgi:hypothetical protein
VLLDDLHVGEVRRGHDGEALQEDERDREVRCDDEIRATRRAARSLPKLRDRLGRDATCADDAVDAAIETPANVVHDRVRRGEVDRHVHARIGKRLEPVGHADRDRISARHGRDVIADA